MEKSTLKTTINGDQFEIEKFKLSSDVIKNRSIAVIGPSSSGKTIIVKNMMLKCKNDIPEVFIVCPTEIMNKAYEGYVPPQLIHYYVDSEAKGDNSSKKIKKKELTVKFYEKLAERQEAKVFIYKKANNLELLRSIFQLVRSPTDSELVEEIETSTSDAIINIKKKYKGSQGIIDQKEKNINEKFQKILLSFYKEVIRKNYDKLNKLKKEHRLDKDQIFCLKYLGFNPSILLVLDDCGAEYKSTVFTSEVFRKMIYQGRHMGLTSIICLQDETDMPAPLRKNFFITILTTPQSSTSYFERTTNGFAKSSKKIALPIIERIFNSEDSDYKKLVYYRDDPNGKNYYYLQVSIPPLVCLVGEKLEELCHRVEKTDEFIDKDNEFVKKYM